MRDGLREIVATVRREPQPYWVEMRTYRYRGHSMSDPGLYRTKEELDKYKDLDPIAKLSKQLQDEGVITAEQSPRWTRTPGRFRRIASPSPNKAPSRRSTRSTTTLSSTPSTAFRSR